MRSQSRLLMKMLIMKTMIISKHAKVFHEPPKQHSVFHIDTLDYSTGRNNPDTASSIASTVNPSQDPSQPSVLIKHQTISYGFERNSISAVLFWMGVVVGRPRSARAPFLTFTSNNKGASLCANWFIFDIKSASLSTDKTVL